MLGNGRRERIVRCVPSPRLSLPLIHREAVHPAEGKHIGISEPQLERNLDAQTTENFGRKDARPSNDQEQIAIGVRCCTARCRPEHGGCLWREELCDRRTNFAVWLQRDPDEAIGAVTLGALR